MSGRRKPFLHGRTTGLHLGCLICLCNWNSESFGLRELVRREEVVEWELEGLLERELEGLLERELDALLERELDALLERELDALLERELDALLERKVWRGTFHTYFRRVPLFCTIIKIEVLVSVSFLPMM